MLSPSSIHHSYSSITNATASDRSPTKNPSVDLAETHPFIRVTSAHLDYFNLTQEGYLSTGLSIMIKAENDNEKAHASFSNFRYDVSFHGLGIARLQATPFDIGKNESVDFVFVFKSESIPLDSGQLSAADLSLKRKCDCIRFDGKFKG
ncbi:hypothetical protein Ancab_033122 [Ancistrocladus abbreviatus]